MKYEVRGDSVVVTGYVNAVERLSKPIRENLRGKITTFLERIRSGVFRTALKRNDDVLVLLNHDENRVLASTKDGNAILEEDNIGLRAEITITDKEVVQKAREGKLSGWSFGFICNDDEVTSEGNNTIRTVNDMDILEVSILDDTKSPAYYGTSISTREGGARMKETRTDEFTEETTEEVVEETAESIDLDALAEMVAEKVAIKVIEALKTETKAEETEETETEAETEENETETEEETEAEETETEEVEQKEENRSIDYSAFETRLSNLKK
jgi:HK97 family phage prohead protease